MLSDAEAGEGEISGDASGEDFPLMKLPGELLLEIYSYFDANSAKQMMQTCKRNYEIINPLDKFRYLIDDVTLNQDFEALCRSERIFQRS